MALAFYHRELAEYVARTGNSTWLNAKDDREVHAIAMQLNRWKKKKIEDDKKALGDRPAAVLPHELDRLVVCKRFAPPHILLEYDTTPDQELCDAEGNPLGFTMNDLAWQHYERVKAEYEERAEDVPSDAEKERFLADLAKKTGVDEDDLDLDI